MGDVIIDTLLDFVKILPFLFLTYLLMEWLEHRSAEKTNAFLSRAGKLGPLVGGVCGAIPQCGFSAAASSLYAGRVITLGTLIAVYLSTSDEMLPIVLSNVVSGDVPFTHLLRILGVKMLLGVVFGMVIDFVFRKKTENGHDGHEHIEEVCEREHCHCDGEHGIFLSALKHTVQVGGFLLLIMFALNTAVHFIGEDNLARFLSDRGVAVCLLSALVGLIPNCAASVTVTQLYLGGILSVGGLYAGLLTGAGIGLLVLFRTNRPHWENILIAVGLWAIGAGVGCVIDLAGFTWLGL